MQPQYRARINAIQPEVIPCKECRHCVKRRYQTGGQRAVSVYHCTEGQPTYPPRTKKHFTCPEAAPKRAK